MKTRVIWIAAAAVVGSCALAAAGWPILTGRVARHIEERLQLETGQPWRIDSVGFDLTPGLILNDVSTGRSGSTPVLAVRRVHLSGPLALLRGEAGTARVEAEGLNLRTTIDPLPSAPRVTAVRAGTPGLSTVGAVLRGVTWNLVDDGRTLVAAAPSAQVDLALVPTTTETAVTVDLEAPSHRVRLALERPAAGGDGRPLRVTFEPKVPQDHRAAVQANLRTEPAGFRLDGLTGTVDGGALTGEIQVDLADRPKLNVDLRLDALTLAREGDAAAATGLTVPLPAAVVPDPKWFAAFEAQARLSIGRLAIGPARIETVLVAATVRKGVLDAAMSAAKAYDGALKVRYGLSTAGDHGRHRLTLTLANGQVRSMLSSLLGVGAIEGRATVRLDLDATGGQPDALLKSATGSVEASVVDGGIDGSGLALLTSGLLGQEGGGIATRFSYLGGRARIAQGRGTTDDLQLRSALIESTGSGVFDLLDQTLDLTFQPSVTPQRGRRPGAGKGLSVPVRVVGPWADPAVSADMSRILDNPAGAVEALQDLGSGLFGGQGSGPGGSGLGGLLDGLFPKSGQDAKAGQDAKPGQDAKQRQEPLPPRRR